jgi:hypothetical protein
MIASPGALAPSSQLVDWPVIAWPMNARDSEVIDRLVAVNATILTPLVRQVVGTELAVIRGWTCSQLQGGLMGAGVYRLSGTATVRGTELPWSILLKVVRRSSSLTGLAEPISGCPGGAAESSGSGDTTGSAWRREPLAYSSGILRELPVGIAAPQCFGVEERSGAENWIWLEDVPGKLGTEWSRERIVLGARHLGRFNGAYLVGEPLPSALWLQRDMLTTWIAYLTPSVERLFGELAHGHTLLQRGWPTDVVDTLRPLWGNRDRLCDALHRLPQTFCHHDANARNLIARCDADVGDRTVAVDWAFAGIGPLGYEIVPLCGELLPSFRFEFTDAMDLIEEIFTGYLAGLTDVGWRGDRGSVRIGFTAALAMRYGACGGPANVSDLLDGARLWVPEQRWGRPIGEIMDRWADCSRFVLRLADEARALLE